MHVLDVSGQGRALQAHTLHTCGQELVNPVVVVLLKACLLAYPGWRPAAIHDGSLASKRLFVLITKKENLQVYVYIWTDLSRMCEHPSGANVARAQKFGNLQVFVLFVSVN